MFTILIVILILILINGFFAASEMALVSIKPSELHRIKNEGNKNADLLSDVTKDSTKYLSTIQVAITFAGFLSSAFAGNTLSSWLVDVFASINITISESLGVILITVILSFFTLVLGELVPKRLAMNNPIRFALLAAPVINIFMKIFKPFVWLLTISTNGVLKLFGIKSSQNEDTVTESEIKEMIVYGHIKGLYPTEETKMMQRIFKFDDLTSDMIMTPIDEVIGYDLQNPDLKSIIDSRYSRIPVFNGNKNNIAGVIFIKDLLLELKDKNIDDIDIKSLIREPYIINENLKINELFNLMRESLRHMAFIVDENNKTEGIVTLEDIVEEIVGNIYDEHDILEEDYEKENEFTYIIDGDNLVSDIIGKLGITIDNEITNYETIHDFIISKIGDLPKEGEQPIIEIDTGSMKVLNLEDNKIGQVEVVLDETKINYE